MTGRSRGVALIVLALVGLVVSGYLAAFQLGLVAEPWDPLFGEGSRRVLTSAVSRILPVPDAAVGAAAYLVELLLGVALLAGARAWVAGLLAVVASAGASVALVLVVLQPLVAGALCSLCLVSAAVSIALAIGAVTEARDRLYPNGFTAHAHGLEEANE